MGRMAGVVQAHGQYLARHHRRQQLYVGQLVDVVGQGVLPENVAVDGGHVVAVDDPVVNIPVCFIPGDFHRFLLAFLGRILWAGTLRCGVVIAA